MTFTIQQDKSCLLNDTSLKPSAVLLHTSDWFFRIYMYACIQIFPPPVLSVIIFVPAKSEQAEQLQISQKLLESRQQPTHQAAWRGKADMMRLRCIFPTESWVW